MALPVHRVDPLLLPHPSTAFAAPAPQVCPNCRTLADPTHRFCARCAFQLQRDFGNFPSSFLLTNFHNPGLNGHYKASGHRNSGIDAMNRRFDSPLYINVSAAAETPVFMFWQFYKDHWVVCPQFHNGECLFEKVCRDFNTAETAKGLAFLKHDINLWFEYSHSHDCVIEAPQISYRETADDFVTEVSSPPVISPNMLPLARTPTTMPGLVTPGRQPHLPATPASQQAAAVPAVQAPAQTAAQPRALLPPTPTPRVALSTSTPMTTPSTPTPRTAPQPPASSPQKELADQSLLEVCEAPSTPETYQKPSVETYDDDGDLFEEMLRKDDGDLFEEMLRKDDGDLFEEMLRKDDGDFFEEMLREAEDSKEGDTSGADSSAPTRDNNKEEPASSFTKDAQACARDGCPYKKHSTMGIDHCCKKCQECGEHGKKCEKIKHVQDSSKQTSPAPEKSTEDPMESFFQDRKEQKEQIWHSGGQQKRTWSQSSRRGAWEDHDSWPKRRYHQKSYGDKSWTGRRDAW